MVAVTVVTQLLYDSSLFIFFNAYKVASVSFLFKTGICADQCDEVVSWPDHFSNYLFFGNTVVVCYFESVADPEWIGVLIFILFAAQWYLVCSVSSLMIMISESMSSNALIARVS